MQRRLDSGELAPKEPMKGTVRAWAERQLMLADMEHCSSGQRLQAFRHIFNKGGDPRRAVRRIPVEELPAGDYARWKTTKRKQTDVASDKGGKSASALVEYLEVPIDLVARAETLWPGTSDWFRAPLWRLVSAPLMKLEEVAQCSRLLLSKLGLFRPSPMQQSEMEQALGYVPLSGDRTSRYEATFLPLVEEPTGTSFSLLVSLTLESFLAEKEELCDVHRDLLTAAANRLLSYPVLRDIGNEFIWLVVHRAVNLAWEDAPNHARWSVDTPILQIAEFEDLTGMKLIEVPQPSELED